MESQNGRRPAATRRTAASIALALAVSLVFALTACGSADAPEASPDPATAGGWPQATDGRITEAMCALLAPADYERYGRSLAARVPASDAPDPGNAVACTYRAGDALSLNLQPTAEAATLLFAHDLAQQRERMKGSASQLAEGVLPGADQSWFDVAWTSAAQRPEYELRARRGALLLTLHLGGVASATATDPKETLVGLAGLVLQRAPELGRADTGTTHKVRYEVTGKGKAQKIIYVEPTVNVSRELTNVTLPWSIELPMASHGAQPVPVRVTALAEGAGAAVGCSAAVDAAPVKQEPAKNNFVTCAGQYVERPA